jgi:hypothetical protein
LKLGVRTLPTDGKPMLAPASWSAVTRRQIASLSAAVQNLAE